ncbi:DUF3857 and transglutaminase domain-containing protein [Lentimicrobium sp.]|uniref:DUF3857 domain-containing transglutaminase family protein n=1 Tax=Lentimicrobium sp. TaxID=2034841 RepID=UPI002B97FEB8|nr:DUF3857 and transglutaminase domain-containing protein [Lentimicrobium sp.]HPJ61381.1 DUF3857 and transglutaminase domain-containing protein [Lentimicrobium sp.]
MSLIIRILLPVFLLPLCLPAYTQNYAASLIPEELMKNANSVIREHKVSYTINSEKEVIKHQSYAITILNQKADNQAVVLIPYNTAEKISLGNFMIYDASGKKVRTVKSSEILDRSYVDNMSLYTDLRLKYLKAIGSAYPFTLVYSYEIKSPKLYVIDNFQPYASENQSVQYAEISVINNAQAGLHVSFSGENQPDISSPDAKTTVWSFRNLPSISNEPYAPNAYDIVPGVFITPDKLYYSGYSGSAATWADYGQWKTELLSGRDQLPVSSYGKYRQLTANCNTKTEKVRKLYKHLQSTTHYINISTDIGGLQPHHAADVENLGYGDCKDLSNFMVAMLKAVDIEAFYTAIKAGTGKYQFFMDHPGHQSNHIIVCVPLENDTIWLECTNQENPFGYVGQGIDNRFALIVDGNRSRVVKTPSYSGKSNTLTSNFRLETDGNDTFLKGSFRFGGLFAGMPAQISRQTMHDQQQWVIQNLEMRNFNLRNHQFRIYDFEKVYVNLEIAADIPGLFAENGGRIYLPLNLNNRIKVPEKVRNRKYPLVIDKPFTQTDTVTIVLPHGFIPELMPEANLADADFGHYFMKTSFNKGEITCVREFCLKEGRYAPERYKDFQAFMQNVSIADSKQLVLKKE